MYTLKIRRIGNSLGVTLPKEVLAQMKLGEGDEVILTEHRDGFAINPYAADLELAMKAFDRGRRKYRNALRELAK
jgi:putative addiction module antidote